MANMGTMAGISIQACDISGQRIVNIPSIPFDATIGELTRGLLSKMQLPDNITYQVHLERESRHLNASERVSDALQTGDRVVLQPSIDAGGQ
jgi:hypothetical protein